MSVSVAPLTTTVMNALDSSLAGAASGVNNAVSRAAGLMAIAVLGIVMHHAFSYAFNERTAALSPSVREQVAAQRSKLAAIEVPPEASEAEQREIHAAVSASFVHGFRWVMLIAASLALASSLSASLMIGSRAENRQ
jgi:hypothetical protein